MSFLEHRVPPALVVLLCAGAMWFAAAHTPHSPHPLIVEPGGAVRVAAAGLICILGLAVMLAGGVSFRSEKTTVNPLKPETATALVTGGIYRYTRNPMYLGMLLILLAWAVFLSAPAAYLGVVGFWLYMDRLQIRPEEKALAALFGSAFTDYTSRVRRWL